MLLAISSSSFAGDDGYMVTSMSIGTVNDCWFGGNANSSGISIAWVRVSIMATPFLVMNEISALS